MQHDRCGSPLNQKMDGGGTKSCSAYLSCAVTDYDIDYLGFVSILERESLFCVSNKGIVQLILYKVDGASSESSSHDT